MPQPRPSPLLDLIPSIADTETSRYSDRELLERYVRQKDESAFRNRAGEWFSGGQRRSGGTRHLGSGLRDPKSDVGDQRSNYYSNTAKSGAHIFVLSERHR